jgi:hypothetical protein
LTVLDLGDLVIIGLGLAFVLRSPQARNRRSVMTLSLLVITYVAAAAALSGITEGIVKIGVVWTYGLIVLRIPRALGMPSASDARTDHALRSIIEPVNASLDVWKRDPSPASMTRTAETTETALERLAALSPVPGRWRTTAELLRRYLAAVRDAAMASDAGAPVSLLPQEVAGPGFDALLQELDNAWRRAARV